MKVIELKITLRGSQKPPIWRKVQVPLNINFQQLHAIIQGAMGWMNGHLHQFTDGYGSFAIGMPDNFGMMDDIEDGRKVKLSQFLNSKGDNLMYEYDFGDGWKHKVEVQKVLEAEKGQEYPRLINGKGQCPPEDCGGIWGYYHMVEAINDPKHEDHEDMVEWSGTDEWDLSEFDEAYHRERMKWMFKNAGNSYGPMF